MFRQSSSEPVGVSYPSASHTSSPSSGTDDLDDIVLEVAGSSSSNNFDMTTVASPPPISRSKRITLSWQNIHYRVKLGGRWGRKAREEKVILNNVSGIVEPGELLAVMGPSGSGKSTLLDVLAGRVVNGLSGEILINGQQPDPREMKTNVAYVQQEDALYAELTVRENLWFSAMLRLPRDMTMDEKEKRVDEVISELGLRKAADTKIGNEVIRGISGGEKRRVSMGMELITRPSLLLLDEPSSGLDSKSTLHLIELLRDLAKKGKKTIVCTIHQPSSYVISLFDNVNLLAKGNPIFFGSIPDTIQFFKTNGRTLPPSTNPADFFIESINFDFSDKPSQADSQVKALSYNFCASEYSRDLTSKIEAVKGDDFGPKYETTFLTQLYYLTYRVILCWLRDPTFLLVKSFVYSFLAIVTGTLYLQLDYTQDTINDRLTALTFSPAFLMFIAQAGMPAFISAREKFVRERMNGYYAVLPYAIATSVVNDLCSIVMSVAYTSVIYYMIGFNPDASAFWFYVLCMISCLLVAEAIANVVSTLTTEHQAANATLSGLFATVMLTSGFFIRANNIPGWWIWIHYLSFQKYTFESLMVSEFSDAAFPCNVLNFTGSTTPNNSTPVTDNSTAISVCGCFYPDLNQNCVQEGSEILRAFGYEDVNKFEWIGILLGMWASYRIIYYVSLRWLVNNRR